MIFLHWHKACNLSSSFKSVEIDGVHWLPPKRPDITRPVQTITVESRAPMACRIERRVIDQDLLILCISGRIAERDVDTLRSLLEQEERVVAIDLKDVLIVGSDAIKFLALCEANGIELRNCPPYIREWLTRVAADKRMFGER